MIVMSWIVEKKLNTSAFVPLKYTTYLKLDTCTTNSSDEIKTKREPVNVCEDDTTGNAYTSHTIEEAKLHNDPVKSDDDFMPPNKASLLSNQTIVIQTMTS